MRPSKLNKETHQDVLDVFGQILNSFNGENIQIDQIIQALGARSFGFGILTFSLPMIVPMPPGIPMASGCVISIFSVQLILGRRHLWLPNWLATKHVSHSSLTKAHTVAERYIGWIFRLARPRFPQMTGPGSQRIAGLLFIILALLMILPIPFIGNILPAFAITILALGLTDRDGLIYVAGLVIAMIAIGLMSVMGVGTWRFLTVVF